MGAELSTQTNFTCGEGTVLSDGKCVVDTIQSTKKSDGVKCGEGTVLSDGKCVVDTIQFAKKSDSVKCGPGTLLGFGDDGRICLPDPNDIKGERCGPGTVFNPVDRLCHVQRGAVKPPELQEIEVPIVNVPKMAATVPKMAVARNCEPNGHNVGWNRGNECCSKKEINGTCHDGFGTVPAGKNVGWFNGVYCMSGKEESGKCK